MVLTDTSSEGKYIYGLMNGVSALLRGLETCLSLITLQSFLACENTLTKYHFWRLGPHQRLNLPEACPWTSQTPLLWETHFCWLKMTCVKLFCNSSRNRQGSGTQRYSEICQLLLTLSLQQLSKMRSVNSFIQCRDQRHWPKVYCHSPVQQTIRDYTYICTMCTKCSWSWRMLVT